jgi:hypothetical protein
MIQPSHLHETFLDNVVTSDHQAKIASLNYSLEAQNKKIKRKEATSKSQ